MAIKIIAKNKKLNGTFAGIAFKNGVATVDGADKRKAIVMASRSGLEWEDTSKKDDPKVAPKEVKKEAK